MSTYTVALAGNPNVGKSTVFNALTGLRQHTGNWPGKTVSAACGRFSHQKDDYILYDLPGTYSLSPHSPEEAAARDLLCFGAPDAVIAVCDAGALEHGLHLVLQLLELCGRVVLCLNLWDEAEKQHLRLHPEKLEKELGIPVVCTSARSGKGLPALVEATAALCQGPVRPSRAARLPGAVGAVVRSVATCLQEELPPDTVSPHWLARMLCEEDTAACRAAAEHLQFDPALLPRTKEALHAALATLRDAGISKEDVRRQTAAAFVIEAEGICAEVAECPCPALSAKRKRLDRILTGRLTGIPCMLLLLGLVLWVTIRLSNVPSAWLSTALLWLGEQLQEFLSALLLPPVLISVFVDGVWRVAAWVTAVMLPPMAIFFPLFTLLEDAGLLPRIAYNLDPAFQKAGACGKQALTMCMGFGCNALGVQGCRIIDSPREQKLAMLTNVFVPCNGRFPFLITIITLFFSAGTFGGSLVLTAVIAGSIGLSLWVSRILSRTLLRGTPSAFTLELPAFRRPQVGQVILRGVIDRVFFVLGRALKMAAPAGLVLWLLANLRLGEQTLLALAASALDPFARLLGLDGVILLAFVLGFPANEIVLPIILMGYLGGGTLAEAENLSTLAGVLQANGWTLCTALCTLLFALLHWPCAATCATLWRETHSKKDLLLAVLVPTLTGCVLCLLTNALWQLAAMVL